MREYPPAIAGFTVTRWKQGRNFAVHDATGSLVAVCVYKKGATEVARRLSGGLTQTPCVRESNDAQGIRHPTNEKGYDAHAG